MKTFALGLLLSSSIVWAQVPQSMHIWILPEENHSYESRYEGRGTRSGFHSGQGAAATFAPARRRLRRSSMTLGISCNRGKSVRDQC